MCHLTSYIQYGAYGTATMVVSRAAGKEAYASKTTTSATATTGCTGIWRSRCIRVARSFTNSTCSFGDLEGTGGQE